VRAMARHKERAAAAGKVSHAVFDDCPGVAMADPTYALDPPLAHALGSRRLSEN
jgi:hypothetical protein